MNHFSKEELSQLQWCLSEFTTELTTLNSLGERTFTFRSLLLCILALATLQNLQLAQGSLGRFASPTGKSNLFVAALLPFLMSPVASWILSCASVEVILTKAD